VGSHWTQEQRAAIQAEAREILSHPSFKNSKRCIALFPRLVEHALNGDQEGVKERTLGIEVFGRDNDYDTNIDPIVRMTANEIRKRLAQYYQESTRHSEVKIRLVPGSYLPTFEFAGEEHAAARSEDGPREALEGPLLFPVADVPHEEASPAKAAGFSLRSWKPWEALILLMALAYAASLPFHLFTSTQELIWTPLLGSNEPVTICVANSNASRSEQDGWAATIAAIISTHKVSQPLDSSVGMPSVPFVDATVSNFATAWLSHHRKSTTLQLAPKVTLDDLRKGPVLLVGAFDNQWSLILLSDLRFRVRVDPVTQDEWVEDAQNPAKREWKGSGKLLYSDSSVDYAIVTRILAPETGKWILAAGGLGMHGTEAAGELLTDPAYSKTLPAALRSTNKNLQIVLKTTVIDGHTGPPQILAYQTW